MIIIDTGYLVALLDRRDHHHARAKALSTTADDGWITTWPVVMESVYLLDRRVGAEYGLAVVDDVARGGLSLWDIPASQAARMATLMRKYANLPMDLADASLVLLAEHIGHGRILSTDQRDFGTYRWKNRKPFKNLMEPLS